MPETVILLSIPGLRAADVERMPNLRSLTADGDRAPLVPSFPCVTCPVQVNMTTGQLPRKHGVTANGFYWRDKHEIEMWTAWNEVVQVPQIWDILSQHDSTIVSAVWFPLLSKGCEAELICTPAPIHNPDGSKSLWCYTRPTEMYGMLRDKLGHFPLKHFWGPLANIQSTDWIAKSLVAAAEQWHPNFLYAYFPHLDYAAQKFGPDSPQALASLADLDRVLGEFVAGITTAYEQIPEQDRQPPLYIIASEYAIVPVNHVEYPNRILREAGLLKLHTTDQGEEIDFAASDAWALVDHQFAQVYIRNANEAVAEQVRKLFKGRAGIDEVLVGIEREKYDLDHERLGEVILVSKPNSWLAYYWWTDDAAAPKYARTVDIHRKPGYDPVELCVDMATRSIPLDATLIRGSHVCGTRGCATRRDPHIATRRPRRSADGRYGCV